MSVKLKLAWSTCLSFFRWRASCKNLVIGDFNWPWHHFHHHHRPHHHYLHRHYQYLQKTDLQNLVIGEPNWPRQEGCWVGRVENCKSSQNQMSQCFFNGFWCIETEGKIFLAKKNISDWWKWTQSLGFGHFQRFLHFFLEWQKIKFILTIPSMSIVREAIMRENFFLRKKIFSIGGNGPKIWDLGILSDFCTFFFSGKKSNSFWQYL